MIGVFRKLLIFTILPLIAIGILLVETVDLKSEILKGSILGVFINDKQQQSWIINKKVEEANSYLTHRPLPVSSIEMEGRLDKDPLKIKSINNLKDVWKVYALNFTYYWTNDEKYLDKSTEFLLSWANNYSSEGNPIDDSHLEPMIVSYPWIRDSLEDQDRAVIDSWLVSIYTKNYSNTEVSLRFDNWNSHRVNIMGQIAFAIEDPYKIQSVITEFNLHLENNLNPDGSTVDFNTRDSLHYHIYDLTPLLSLAKTAKLNKFDLYSYTTSKGANLNTSVNFLIPYVNGKKMHKEYVNSNVTWDKFSAKSGQPQSQIGRMFKPNEGLQIMELYHFFNPKILPLIQSLRANYAIYPSFEVLLNTLETSVITNN